MCIAADLASDELLSAGILRSGTLAGGAGVLTPNLRFVLRDKAHASRRIISRPGAADVYVKDVVDMFARGRGSVARMIQNPLETGQVSKVL